MIYIDFDAFKERDFDVYIYHVKDNFEKNDFLKRNIMLILFLFKSLNDVEFHY